MAVTTSRGRLRRLAELRPAGGRVLSVYLDLDPAEFATGAARAAQLNAVLDEAAKLVEQRDDLDHDDHMALREDVERIRQAFDPQRMGAGGARGIAVFANGRNDLFEVVRTPYPLEAQVVVDDTPYLEPLAGGERERWCVVLVSRREGRIFLGDEGHLDEVTNVSDDTHGQHSKGGWSQRRYEESVENEKQDHLGNVAARLLRLLRRRPFDRLVVGGPEPIDAQLAHHLHPYLKDRLVPERISADVDSSSAADVLQAAAPVFETFRRDHEREAIERLRAGLGRGEDGRAVAGLPDVLAALNEQRVEVLLLEPGTSRRGWVDPNTGYLAADPGVSPTGELQEREDVVEAAIEKAIEQSAEVLVLRDQPDLGPHGGIAALLRF